MHPTNVNNPARLLERRGLMALSFALAALLLLPIGAQAQTVIQGSEGTVGIYFDEALTQTTLSGVTPNSLVTIYVGFTNMLDANPAARLSAFEMQFTPPPGWIVTATVLNPPEALNLGTNTNLIVGTGSVPALAPTGGTYVAATITLFATTPGPEGFVMEPVGSTPSSATPPAPVWVDGDPDNTTSGNDIYLFAETVRAVLNPVPCEVTDVSFAGTVVSGLDGGGAELWTYDAGKTVTGATVDDLDEDGDANVVYWTEASATENGEIGYLGCQGDLVWNFVDSGWVCDPATASGNFLDVVDVIVDEFDASNPGNELLLIAGSEGLTRLTLHALDGSLRNDGDAEVWADYTLGVVAYTDDSVYLGGLNSDGFAAVLRESLSSFRGSTVGTSPCAEGGVVEAVFDGGALPEDTTNVETLDVLEGVLTVATGSATYDLDATTLAALVPPCEVAAVGFGGLFVTATDGADATLWTYEANAPVLYAELEGLAGDDQQYVTVVAADGSVVLLDCQGALLDDGFAFANCYGDTGTQTAAGPVVTGNGLVWFLVTDDVSGNTRLSTVTRQGDALVESAAYDLPGIVTASLLAEVAGLGETLFLGFQNGFAASAAQVVALSPDAISGSAPPVQTGCEAGSEIWSALFDGNGYPDLAEPVSFFELIEGTFVVTIGDQSFELDPATGELVVLCELADVSVDGSVVSGLRVGGSALFTYDAAGPVVLAEIFEGLSATPVIIGLADATDTTQAQLFQIDCEGNAVFETPLIGDANCFEVAQPQATVNTDVTGFGAFTAEGATELWAVLGGAADGGPALTFVVTVDLAAWSFVGTYEHFGAVASILPLDGFPLQVAMGGSNQGAFASAFVIEAGANGASAPGCAVTRLAEGELWYAIFDGSTLDRPVLTSSFDSIVRDVDVLTYGNADGVTVDLNRPDGAAVATGITVVELEGTEVVALDSDSGEIFRRDLGVILERADLLDFDGVGEPEIVVAGSGNVYGLTAVAQGQTLWSVEPADYEVCFTDPVDTRSVAEFVAGVDVGGTELIVVVFETTNPARLALLGLGLDGSIVGNLAHNGARVQHEVLDFDTDGTIDVLLLGTDANGNGVLFLASLDALDGATPTDLGACAGGGATWALAFDGVDLPLETDPVAFVVDGDRATVEFGSGASYVVTSDGVVLTDIALAITPATAEAKPGETYAIALTVDNAPNLAAIQGLLTYDAAVLEFVDAAGALAGFSSALNADVAGEVRFAFASDSNLGQSAATLLDVEFVVREGAAVGTSSLSLGEVLAFDENVAAVGVLVSDATVDVGCETSDVNGDGQIRSDDAVITLRIAVGLIADPTPFELCASDVNGDGETDSGDAVLILRQVVGLPIDTEPVLARSQDLRVSVDDAAKPLGDGRYELRLRVAGEGSVAGLDLRFGTESGWTVETIGTVGGNAASALRVDGRHASFAAASASALEQDGSAGLRVVLRSEDEDATVIRLDVLEGRAYAVDGVRTDLREVSTMSFEVATPEIVLPRSTELLQNTPNPFNPRTEIRFRLAETSDVRVTIFDVAGRRVKTFDVGTKAPGEYGIVWSGDDAEGRAVSSGVYLYQLLTREGVVGSKRMTLVR